MSSDQFKQTETIIRRYEEVSRFLAIMVERAGGEVMLLPSELAEDRTLAKGENGLGAVVLRVERR